MYLRHQTQIGKRLKRFRLAALNEEVSPEHSARLAAIRGMHEILAERPDLFVGARLENMHRGGLSLHLFRDKVEFKIEIDARGSAMLFTNRHIVGEKPSAKRFRSAYPGLLDALPDYGLPEQQTAELPQVVEILQVSRASILVRWECGRTATVKPIDSPLDGFHGVMLQGVEERLPYLLRAGHDKGLAFLLPVEDLPEAAVREILSDTQIGTVIPMASRHTVLEPAAATA